MLRVTFLSVGLKKNAEFLEKFVFLFLKYFLFTLFAITVKYSIMFYMFIFSLCICMLTFANKHQIKLNIIEYIAIAN